MSVTTLQPNNIEELNFLISDKKSEIEKGEYGLSIGQLTTNKIPEDLQLYILKFCKNIEIRYNYTNESKLAAESKFINIINQIASSTKLNTELSKNPLAPEKTLHELAKHILSAVRANVVKNPSTPEKLLETLSFDSNIEVLRAFSYNNRVNEKILKRAILNPKLNFYEDLNLDYYDGLMRNPNTPAEIIERIYQIIRNVNIVYKPERKALFLNHPKTPKVVVDGINNKDSRCFIATAVYDSSESEEVLLFRQFRDEKLNTTVLGRISVNLYYLMSPQIARTISTKATTKKNLRKKIFNPIYKYIKKTVYNNAEQTLDRQSK
ncbi:CFI-box-CTERM domain-containing protein [Kordia jejudonensis]|uniref:CFI-box-CTERM domain-containing protein n=1 Tax=Kordia jejudonensis TaxID=1348245 RepID=UPI0006296EA3|nr:CFI-box-CTERM domain-containing protein [Kordia jejudonensis]